MANDQQAEFIQIVKRHLPRFFSGKRVIEMGSLDINGSARGHFDAAHYVGVDLGPGPSVDLIAPGQMVDEPSGSFDCAISANCFEHNPYWLETFVNMLRLVRAGGIGAVYLRVDGIQGAWHPTQCAGGVAIDTGDRLGLLQEPHRA